MAEVPLCFVKGRCFAAYCSSPWRVHTLQEAASKLAPYDGKKGAKQVKFALLQPVMGAGPSKNHGFLVS